MNLNIGRISRVLLFAAAAGVSVGASATELLNASYDISRELFQQINPVFEAHWKDKTGETIKVNQSHAGSTRQAQAIIQGLKADVVTFNQVTDVQILHDKGNFVP